MVVSPGHSLHLKRNFGPLGSDGTGGVDPMYCNDADRNSRHSVREPLRVLASVREREKGRRRQLSGKVHLVLVFVFLFPVTALASVRLQNL